MSPNRPGVFFKKTAGILHSTWARIAGALRSSDTMTIVCSALPGAFKTRCVGRSPVYTWLCWERCDSAGLVGFFTWMEVWLE